MRKIRITSNSNLYEEARERKEYLDDYIEKMQSVTYPEGKIHVVKNKRRLQFYLRTDKHDKSGQYLRQSEQEKIRTYLQKEYDRKILKLAETEVKRINGLLNCRAGSEKIKRLYSDMDSRIKKYIVPLDISDEEYALLWMGEPFEHKDVSDLKTEYYTDNDERVRSKSEINIANMLRKNGVPYKYECPLFLKGCGTIHPDFTALNVRRRKVIYWEHRGMMDDTDYVVNSMKRIKDYQRNGIFLGDELILTEESSTVPLGTREIQRIIEKYLL